VHLILQMNIAVLGALNIADEYFKILDYNKELEKRVENPEYELRVIKDKLNHITKEFDEKNLMKKIVRIIKL